MLKPLVIHFWWCSRYPRRIPREKNREASALAQQASGYAIVKKYFHIQKPMQAKAELQVLDEPVQPVNSTGLTAQTGLTGHETGLTAQTIGDTQFGYER